MISRVSCGLLFAIAVGLLIGCHSPERPSQNINSQNRAEQKSEDLDETEILKHVVTFSSDEDEKSEGAWKGLSSYPPKELREKLSQISVSLPEDDRNRVLIAFVLCYLDYDYQRNRDIVASSLSDNSRYREFYAAWSGELINRLIKKGDKELISFLFKGTKGANGAFASSLSGYLTQFFRREPQYFLRKLREEPMDLRFQVYDQFIDDEMLTKDDIKQIKAQLQSIPKNSEVSQVAQEMFRSISQKRSSS